MPTYEYQCQSCGIRVEVVQSFHDAALTTCGACGGDLRKVFSPVGIVFKGSGFYKNDSRPAPAKSDSAKSDPAKPAASDSAKPASAPAATASTASSD